MKRPFVPAAFAFASLFLPNAYAEEAKGPVHIEGRDGSEARAEAREQLADAREDLADSERELLDTEKDIARMEAGDFSGTVTIVDDKVIKCGDPSRYPGCTPYTAEEKAQMVAEARRDLEQAKRDIAQAKHDLEQAERDLASAE